MSSQLNIEELSSYLNGYWISDLANFSAFLFQHIPDLNWAGFYLNDGTKLRLGPFMGKPACLEIRFGHGVCGQAFLKNEPLIVGDVDAFPGHIRCDSMSRSELVVPFVINGELQGVLDLDSPKLNRFQVEDLEIVQEALKVLSQKIEGFSAGSFGFLRTNMKSPPSACS